MPPAFNADLSTGYAFSVATQAGKAMKKLMRGRGLRITHVMEKTGWSRATISRHVNGLRVPNFEQRERYAELLGVETDVIDVIWNGQSPPNDEDSARLVLRLSPRIYEYLRPITENTDLTIEDAAELLIIEAAERRAETGEEDDTSYVPPEDDAPSVRAGGGEKSQLKPAAHKPRKGKGTGSKPSEPPPDPDKPLK